MSRPVQKAAGRRQARIALSIHRAAITARAYLRPGSLRARVLIYVHLLSIAMDKGWSGIARLIKGDPAAGTTYRLRGRPARLVTLTSFALFSATST